MGGAGNSDKPQKKNGEAHPTLSLTLCGMGQIPSETHPVAELNLLLSQIVGLCLSFLHRHQSPLLPAFVSNRVDGA